MAETAVWVAILVLYLLGCFVMFMFYRDKGPDGNGKWEHLMLVVGWPWVGLISLLMFVLCRSFRSCVLDPYGEWEDSDKSDGEDEPSPSAPCILVENVGGNTYSVIPIMPDGRRLECLADQGAVLMDRASAIELAEPYGRLKGWQVVVRD
jgi:heme/copper-type cytochrome/quinol oxidase subunit 2